MSLRGCLCRLPHHRPLTGSKICASEGVVACLPSLLWTIAGEQGSGQIPKTDVFGKHARKNTGKHPCTWQDLLAARRERELALDGKQSAQKAVKELERFVAALREQWLQEFQSGNNKKADEVLTKLQDAETKLEDAETKLKVAKQELNDAKQEYEQAKASAQAGPAQAGGLLRFCVCSCCC